MSGIDETVHIPEGPSVQAFLGRIAYVNRRARRLGIALACEEVGRDGRPVAVTRTTFVDGRMESSTRTEIRPCVLFRILCPEPAFAIPGWSFEGYIAAKGAERDTVTGTVRTRSFTPFAQGNEFPQEILDGAFSATGMMRCDHCGTYRNRRIGLVVRHQGGERRIVGSSCSRDYLGHDFKAVAAYFQHIGGMRDALETERRSGWYAVTEYDFEAERMARDAAAARRDEAAHGLRTIVGAVLVAMETRGFYALYGDDATEAKAPRLLDEGFSMPDGEWTKVDEIVDWMRARPEYASLFAGAHDTLALRDYRKADPEFRCVDRFMAAGGIPLGRFYGEAETATLRRISSEPVEFERQSGWQTVTTHRTRHVLGDELGSRFEVTTGSAKLDALIMSDAPFRATFSIRKTLVHRMRALTVVSRLTPVRDAEATRRPRQGRAERPAPDASQERV